MRVALELVLTFGPLALLFALLLLRCYPGEAHLIKHRIKSGLRRVRLRARWPKHAPRAAAPARSPLSRRGPPAPA